MRLAAERPALVNPSNAEIADAFGVMTPIRAGEVFDVAVVGAGPAGLAAAVAASSEGAVTIPSMHCYLHTAASRHAPGSPAAA